MSTEIPVIAVDGPSGTGKGTICRFLATKLQWHLLDSGALYRLIALAATTADVALNDEKSLSELALALNIRFASSEKEHVYLDEKEVSDAIRTEECGSAASKVAALPAVRQALLKRQRKFRQLPGLVADGRDMGTVVFPDAKLKVFLTASPEERAKRRYKQLIEKGISVNLRGLSADIAERDRRDKERAVSPLVAAEDAIFIDSTNSDVDSVLQQVVILVHERFTGHSAFVPFIH